MTDEKQKTPKSGRTLRRLRRQFRKELLDKAKPTPSDQTLIDLAAQAALRVREMRTEIAAGNRVPDEDQRSRDAPTEPRLPGPPSPLPVKGGPIGNFKKG